MRTCRRQAAMTARAEPSIPRGAPSDQIAVRVSLNGCGDWEIALPNQRERVTCETLDDATRVGYLCAASRRPCELIVFDAYHRMLHRQFVDGHGESSCERRQHASTPD